MKLKNDNEKWQRFWTNKAARFLKSIFEAMIDNQDCDSAADF